MAYAGKANASKTWFVVYAAKLGPSTKLTDDLFLFELSGGVLYNGVISVCFMRYMCILFVLMWPFEFIESNKDRNAVAECPSLKHRSRLS